MQQKKCVQKAWNHEKNGAPDALIFHFYPNPGAKNIIFFVHTKKKRRCVMDQECMSMLLNF